jgi:hypothetical protein
MRWLILGLAVLLLAGGCGLGGTSLEQRAADYYNHLAGHSPKLARSSFLTPAYREELKKAGSLKEYDSFLRSTTKASERYPKAAPEDIAVAQQDKYAITVANPDLGPAFANQQPVRWVRVGRSWYMYIGADTEVGHYGVFPTGLAPPEYEDAAAKAEAAAETGEAEAEREEPAPDES